MSLSLGASVRSNFPLLARSVHERPLIYLDNASTTQKPQTVIDRLTQYYARASLALYNTRADVDALAGAVRAAHARFA